MKARLETLTVFSSSHLVATALAFLLLSSPLNLLWADETPKSTSYLLSINRREDEPQGPGDKVWVKEQGVAKWIWPVRVEIPKGTDWPSTERKRISNNDWLEAKDFIYADPSAALTEAVMRVVRMLRERGVDIAVVKANSKDANIRVSPLMPAVPESLADLFRASTTRDRLYGFANLYPLGHLNRVDYGFIGDHVEDSYFFASQESAKRTCYSWGLFVGWQIVVADVAVSNFSAKKRDKNEDATLTRCFAAILGVNADSLPANASEDEILNAVAILYRPSVSAGPATSGDLGRILNK